MNIELADTETIRSILMELINALKIDNNNFEDRWYCTKASKTLEVLQEYERRIKDTISDHLLIPTIAELIEGLCSLRGYIKLCPLILSKELKEMCDKNIKNLSLFLNETIDMNPLS